MRSAGGGGQGARGRPSLAGGGRPGDLRPGAPSGGYVRGLRPLASPARFARASRELRSRPPLTTSAPDLRPRPPPPTSVRPACPLPHCSPAPAPPARPLLRAFVNALTFAYLRSVSMVAHSARFSSITNVNALPFANCARFPWSRILRDSLQNEYLLFTKRKCNDLSMCEAHPARWCSTVQSFPSGYHGFCLATAL